ncbi:MAG TPA: class I SAM-dependent methyltransferase [Nitrospiraceae bacterium]|nr:class I SAM-dependent methyltransferase [Nitrospiraceae bacterium]
MDPSQCLQWITETLLHAGDRMASPMHVIWLLENEENRGLDDFEAEAVFGSFLDIEVLHQVGRGTPQSRLLIAGTLREDHVGLSFQIGSLAGAGKFRTIITLYLLRVAGLQGSTIFLGFEEASLLAQAPNSHLVKILRRAVSGGWVALGLWVPPHRTEKALLDLKAELTPLSFFCGGRNRVELVRFAEPERLNPPDRLARALEQAGLRHDSSLVTHRLRGETPRASTRGGPYFPGGAYQPMSFDIRVPTGIWNAERWVEIISSPLDEKVVDGDWFGFNAWRQGSSAERLPLLLSFSRMESYLQAMKNSSRLSQTYHEYRVYNWPPPDPSPRCTFLDCGSLDQPWRIFKRVFRLRRMEARSGGRCRLVGEAELREAASMEAQRRSRMSKQGILHQQREEHRYLEQVKAGDSLRADVSDFADFVGRDLGRTLELGSGFGQLAEVLAPRSDGYTRVDLVSRMLVDETKSPGRSGLVADIHALPFRSSSYDTVIANNILEHAYDPVSCLTEICRILRAGGRLFALIPLDALGSQYVIRTHLWKADEQGIRQALSAGGLTVRRLEVIDLYAMEVLGSFPTCRGLVAKVEAHTRQSV